jgi:hypothetical protein
MVSGCQQSIFYHICKKEPQTNFFSKQSFLQVVLQAAYLHYSKYIFCRSLSFGANLADINAKNFAKNSLQDKV